MVGCGDGWVGFLGVMVDLDKLNFKYYNNIMKRTIKHYQTQLKIKLVQNHYSRFLTRRHKMYIKNFEF